MGQGPQSAVRGHEARAQELLDPGRHRAGSDIRLPGHGLVHRRDPVFDPGHRPQLRDLDLRTRLHDDPGHHDSLRGFDRSRQPHRRRLVRVHRSAGQALGLMATAIGIVAGYFGGWIDILLMRFTDIMYAFPDLLLVLVFVAAFGPSFWSIFIARGLVYWVGLARLVRGQVLSIKEKEYVEAAIMTGTSPLKLIVKHLVPNSLGPVIVTLTFGIPAAIFTEAALSFLGIGIRPPEPRCVVI